jgi:hypothetical protein
MARYSPPTSPTGVFVARSSGVFKIKGVLHRYRVGQTFPPDHPLLRARPDAFEALSFGPATPEPRTEA